MKQNNLKLLDNEQEQEKKPVVIGLNSWLFNAGLVGFCNILEAAEVKLNIQGEELIFESEEKFKEALLNFEDKYFSYLIDKYKETLSWYKIVSGEDMLRKMENNIEKNIDDFSEDDLKRLNDYVKDILKKYITSNSYKAAYEFIDSSLEPLKLEKELKTITLKKGEGVSNKKEEILDLIDKSLVLVDYCNLDSAKKHLAAKNIIYTIIKNSWDGISFLNPQTKEKNVYKDLEGYFCNPVSEYLDENKTKYKYNCFVCDNMIKNVKETFSFLNKIGFDANKKSSHIWDFNNDIAMCPVCKLIYSCVPAGITYVYQEGMFVNSNHSLRELINVNYKIYHNIYRSKNEDDSKTSLTYKALINSLFEEKVEDTRYERGDIQVVRYENESYRFNIISKKTLDIIEKSKKDLNFIGKAWYTEIKTSFKLYEEVITRIWNNENLYGLIHKLLYYKISRSSDCHFSTEQIMSILNINHRIMEGLNLMEKKELDMNKNAKSAGYYLKESYVSKGAKDKISGLCYKILNGLKLRNRNTVMNIIFNMYLYVGSPVPKIIAEMLNDSNSLEQYGYAFVAGLLSEKYNKKENEGGEK